MVVVNTNIASLRSSEAMRNAADQMGDAMQRLSTWSASTQQQMMLQGRLLHPKWTPRQEVWPLPFGMQMMRFL